MNDRIGGRTSKRDVIKAIEIGFALWLLTTTVMLILDQQSYPEQRIGYRFSKAPICLYHYDAIGDGRDFDSIRIFSIDSSDTDAFVRFQEQSSEWKPLPLPTSILEEAICDRRFDSHISSMLDCANGYWTRGRMSDLYVYDIEERLLYMRQASVVLPIE